jgi:type I restriction enzyme M protein
MRPVKSRILFEQMVGRGTRKGERFTDKDHFTVFDCFDGNGKSKRKRGDSKGDRWHDFPISEVKEREFKLDGLKWLKDDSLEDADDLPEPEELAADAVAELEAVVAELNQVLALLEGNGVEPKSKVRALA